MPPLPDTLIAYAHAAGVDITDVVHRTAKTLLAAGMMNGRPVAVKCLLDCDEFWASKWRHELDIYRVFADCPPGLEVPALLHADPGAGLLVLSWLDGHRLDSDRYPDRPLTEHEATVVLDCIDTLNRWQPAVGRLRVVFDYPDRFARYHAQGFLTHHDLRAVNTLLARAPKPDQANHGDPIPANILITGPDTATLLDWEYTGLFLPGFDLAMLHVLLGMHTDALRTRIDERLVDRAAETAFTLNLVTVLTRELRLHRELPDGQLRATRLPQIETAWAQARDRLHHNAAAR